MCGGHIIKIDDLVITIINDKVYRTVKDNLIIDYPHGISVNEFMIRDGVKLSDNRVLRDSYERKRYVIVVHFNGIRKYISKDYNHKHGFDHSVKLNRAKKFDTIESASEFIDYNHIEDGLYDKVEIKPVLTSLQLLDKEE